MDQVTGDMDALRRATRAAASQRGLAWLADVRGQAFEAFAARGFPTTADEDWRYTDLRDTAALTAARSMQAAPAPSPDFDAALKARFAPMTSAATIVFAGGRFRPELSSLDRIPGLKLTPLGGAPQSDLSAIAARLSPGSSADASPMLALNAALLTDGLSIDVESGAAISAPLYVVHAGAAGTASHTRLLVTLGADSSVTIVEHHLGFGDSLANAVTDVRCDAGARLAYVKIQDEADAATHLAHQCFHAGSASRLELLHVDLGAGLARNDLSVNLHGRGASVTAHGLFFADGSRHMDNHTRVDHAAPDTTSRELYRGIADGRGRGIFNGKVIVHEGAVGTDARLSSQNLLLSATAEIDTKPELEIYADDVRCSHGATTGQLDAHAIFYLRSRGIAADQARRMLIASFAREILRHMPVPALDRHLVDLLRARLPEMREVAELS